jgi:hypothetical protein
MLQEALFASNLSLRRNYNDYLISEIIFKNLRTYDGTETGSRVLSIAEEVTKIDYFISDCGIQSKNFVLIIIINLLLDLDSIAFNLGLS